MLHAADESERSRKSESIKAAILKVERRWGLRASGRMFGGQYEAPAGLAMELPELDRATGFGGVPCGKLTEITGLASSGKLTLALRALATAVRAGGVAAYIDLPGTFYPPAAAAMGIDLERLVVVRPKDEAAAVKAGCAGAADGAVGAEPGGDDCGNPGWQSSDSGATVFRFAAAGSAAAGLAVEGGPTGPGAGGNAAGGGGAEDAERNGGGGGGGGLPV